MVVAPDFQEGHFGITLINYFLITDPMQARQLDAISIVLMAPTRWTVPTMMPYKGVRRDTQWTKILLSDVIGSPLESIILILHRDVQCLKNDALQNVKQFEDKSFL